MLPFSMPTVRRVWMFGLVVAVAAALRVAAQQPELAPPSFVVIRPIPPPARPLPPEADSARERQFSFIAYGDTRTPLDDAVPEVDHARVVAAILSRIKALAGTQFPVRFVIQSGDAVYNGTKGEQLN